MAEFWHPARSIANFYADGPNLYATAATDPDLIVAKISQAERR